ncbi:MAG: hypothetical protein R3F35_03785 [Myxococcota bacterium]
MPLAGPESEALARQLAPRAFRARRRPLLITTSGTTGLPKIVVHDQLRWFHFHRPRSTSGI